MGLEERKIINQFKEKNFPKLKKSVDEAAGFETKIEVNWDSLAEEGMSHLYEEAFPKLYFEPLSEAFKKFCYDELGKNALKDALKKIEICNESDNYGNSAISFADGVLKIDHKITNVDYVKERIDSVFRCVNETVSGDQAPPEPSELVSQIPARTVKEILQDLLWLTKSAREDNSIYVPEVTFGLTYGTSVTGKIVDADLGRKSSVVVAPSSNFNKRVDLVYFAPESIQTISIQRANEAMPYFSAGALDSLDFLESPGKLSLQREILTVCKNLSEIFTKNFTIDVKWETVDASSRRGMGSIREILNLLQECFKQLAEDEFARKELKKNIKTIEISHSEEKHFSLENGTLKISYLMHGSRYDRFSLDCLCEELNKVL